MRIAILNRDRCKPKDCNYLCVRVCPIVRTGGEAIVVDEETKKPLISEDLCTGCGICVKKCPYEAIMIINLPEEVGEPIHQYGANGFRLYNLPTPREGVVGLVGKNGIGKTTALKILSGEITPNLGGEGGWDEVLDRFKGHEIQNYLEKLSGGNVKAVYKPQYVDAIPRLVRGKVKNVLKKADDAGRLEDIISALDLANSLHKDMKSLSGGELQRVAIAAALSREADIYLIDEPGSYLDVRERLNTARVIRNLSDKKIIVVEHDLVVLDYLSDSVHVLFGAAGAYGIISTIKGTRVGINEYLSGFLRAENMRFRDGIKFEVSAPKARSEMTRLLKYPTLEKRYEKFSLTVDRGALFSPQVLGILGPNATGKTTFAKLLAGVEEADNTKIKLTEKISYKPQYIKTGNKLVATLKINEKLVEHFRLRPLLTQKLFELSGGELQRVAIADALSREVRVYLLDEPSAYLDVEERLSLAKYLKKFSHEHDASILVVDHDILLVDYLSDELMVFEGEGGKSGRAGAPCDLRSGMNSFLKKMDVTFRRDPDTGRPRANKPDSQKDREQKAIGEYYYS